MLVKVSEYSNGDCVMGKVMVIVRCESNSGMIVINSRGDPNESW